MAIRLGGEYPEGGAIRIRTPSAELSAELAGLRQRLLRQRAHWLYFERDLRVFDEDAVYLFKPMQRLHWLRSQALVDADEIIAESLTGSRN